MKRIALLLMAIAACAFAQDGFTVIVSKTNPVTHITRAQLRRLILAESATWPAGGKASVLLGPSGDPSRTAVLKNVCGMSEADFSKYILQLSFNGDAKSAPKVLPSNISVRQVVQLTTGSLGIVSAADVNDTVKAIIIN